MAAETEETSSGSFAGQDYLRIHGDFRYRMEWIDSDEPDRSQRRDRIRARIGLEAELQDGLSVHVQLASGEDDPASADQTLGESLSKKPIRLDLAYLSWKPNITGLELQAGKVPLPFLCLSDMIWDPSVHPEGLGAAWQADTEIALWIARAGHWWVIESEMDSDVFLYTFQAAAQWKLTPELRMLTGASAYLYDRLEGQPMLYDGQSFGNSATDANADLIGQDGYEPDLVFAQDFRLAEGFLQLDWNAFLPVSVYAHAVSNLAAETDDFGWLAGMTLGRARVVHSAEFGFNYRSVEEDAVVGAFTDAYSGGGGTDVEGFRFHARYQVTRAIQTGVAWYVQRRDPDGKNFDEQRVQLEVAARF